MSTLRYLILTTLWAALLPAMVVSTPFLVLACFSPGILVAVPLLVLIYFLFQFCFRFFRHVNAAANDGSLAISFPIRIIPFFLPLFYAMTLTSVGFALARNNDGALEALFCYGLPHYVPWTMVLAILASINGSSKEFFVLGELTPAALIAIFGTFYSLRIAMTSKFKIAGILLMLAITFAFGGVAVYSQQHYRENLLRPDSFAVTVRDETNLHEYQPFAEKNKLVKIENPTLTIESNHPVIDGATALYPVYAAAAQAIYRNATPVQFNIGVAENCVLVKGSTTPVAFENLLTGKADMLVMARPSPEQLKKAEEKGIKLHITPIGREAFVFFVSKTNPIDNLTIQNIRDIYSKKITNWNELGGKNSNILAFQRPDNSGSQTAMLHFMDDVPLAEPLQEEFHAMMGGVVNRVADYRNYGNSIGYSFRYFVESMFTHNGIKLLAIDEVAPTVENIRNEKYPFTGEVVIITAGTKNENVQKLIDWFLSPQGQDLLEQVGYVANQDH